MNEPQTNENETPDCSEMVAVLREAYDWLNNDKTLLARFCLLPAMLLIVLACALSALPLPCTGDEEQEGC